MAKRYFYVFGGFGIFMVLMVLMALMAKFEIFRKLKLVQMFLVGLGTNGKATHCLFT
jgi:hypothetical protein